MNAFDEAIERIDQIKAPEKIKPTMIKAFKYFSNYFDTHPEIELNFDKLFEEKLYSENGSKKGLTVASKNLVNGSGNVAGYYDVENNVIYMWDKEYYWENDISIFVHEFIHFIIHNTYEATRFSTRYDTSYLPSWADEMMTEYSTRQIYGDYFLGYEDLMDFADYANKKFGELSVAQFFNGEFNDYIEKYKLYELGQELEGLAAVGTGGSSSSYTNILKRLVDRKHFDLGKNNISFKKYIEELADATLDNNFNANPTNKFDREYNIVDHIVEYAREYLLDRDVRFKSQQIENSIEQYYMQKYLEGKARIEFPKFKIAGFEEFIVNNRSNYIVYGQNGENGILSNFSCREKRFFPLRDEKNLCVGRIHSAIVVEKSGVNLALSEEKGQRVTLHYNEKTRRYDMPNDCEHKYYSNDDHILKSLSETLGLENYQEEQTKN